VFSFPAKLAHEKVEAKRNYFLFAEYLAEITSNLASLSSIGVRGTRASFSFIGLGSSC